MHIIEYKLRRHPFFGRFFPAKLYSNYNEAITRCSQKGYENDAIVNLIVEKRRRLASLDTENLLKKMPLGMVLLSNTILKAAKEFDKNLVRVIDFGGADGGHYLQMRHFLPKTLKLQWVVVETSTMSAAMQEFATEELHFVDDFDKALEMLGGNADVFHTSGALQSVPQPYGFLEKFCAAQIPFMIFNRQSLTLGDTDLVSVQYSLLSWHGWGDIKLDIPDFVVKYPHTSIQKHIFENIVGKSHKTVFQFEENSGAYRIGNHNVQGISYVLSFKDEMQIHAPKK